MANRGKMNVELSENQLLDRLRVGDQRAFTALFYAYKDKLYGFLLGITRSEERAHDLVQDIFLKLWKHRENLVDIDNLDAYLYSMAKNLAFDQLRRNGIISLFGQHSEYITNGMLNCSEAVRIVREKGDNATYNQMAQLGNRLFAAANSDSHKRRLKETFSTFTSL
jgi:RNA polymerase sigma-70 factor (ECF subfamily)